MRESITHRVPRPEQGEERRHHPRAEADWPLQIALDGEVHEARLRDVSRSGVSFYLDRRVNEMTLLRLDIDLPPEAGGGRVRGHGVVVRCRKVSPALEHFEVAVFLNEMEDGEREKLARLVHSRLHAAP